MRLDRQGNVWVQEYVMPGEATETWRRYDPDGRWGARLELPAGIEILDLDEGRLLALMRDDFGVEVVRLFAIESP